MYIYIYIHTICMLYVVFCLLLFTVSVARAASCLDSSMRRSFSRISSEFTSIYNI